VNRSLVLAFGTVCYAIFFGTFLYLVGFLGNVGVPRAIDSGVAAPLGEALLVDTALLVLFGLQHSVMARPGFKAWLTRFVPGELERSTYVLASSIVLMLVCWQWRPMADSVFTVQDPTGRALLQGLFFGGVGLVLYSTCLIDHFDLFGLRQVFLHFRGRSYSEKRFVTPHLYKFIRHPLYVGWLVTFWATPDMTAGHFLFALVMTAYIYVAIPLEERDLAAALGDPYRSYRARTPMFVPRLSGTDRPARPAVESS